MVWYKPTEDGEERDIFWNDLDRVVGIGFRLCILGCLNWVRAGITGAFGVPGEWWNSMLKGVCVLVTHSLSIGACISTQGWQGVEM